MGQGKYTAYKNEWDRKNTKQYKLKLMLSTDQDIIKKLDSVPNKQAYMKGLIRADIATNDTETENTQNNAIKSD